MPRLLIVYAINAGCHLIRHRFHIKYTEHKHHMIPSEIVIRYLGGQPEINEGLDN